MRPKVRLSGRRRRLSARRLFFGLLLLVVVVAGASYRWYAGGSKPRPAGPAGPAKGEAAAEHPTDDPRVVLLTHLSGPFRKDGEMLRLGMEMAWNDLQAKQISGELVVRDAGRTPSEAARAVSELIRNPDVVAIIAHLPIISLVEIAPIAEQEQVLVLVPAGSHQQLIHHPWLLPLVCLDGEEGAYAAMAARDWTKDGTAAVIYSPSTYGELLHEGFMRKARAIALEAAAFASDAEGSSLADTVDRVLQLAPPVIWLAGSPFWGEKIIAALTEKGYQGRLLVPRSYGEILIEDLVGGYLNQLYILRPVVMTEKDNRALRDFCHRFREQFWLEPRSLAVLGYDAVTWLGELLQNGPVRRTALRSAFLRCDSPARAYQGLAGPVYFDSNGRTMRPLQVSVYRDGRFMPPGENRADEGPS